MRTAGAPMPTGASSFTSAETGAWWPRERRWSPYTSNSAERACMCASLPHASPRAVPIGDNGDTRSGERGPSGLAAPTATTRK